MRVRDLTGSFNTRSYEVLFPNLFKHYYSFWASKQAPYLKLNQSEIRNRKRLILSRLQIIKGLFSRFSIKELPDFVLFVGKGTSNGHAFYDDGKWIVWLPIETYKTTLQVDVFVTHEIIHAIHYSKQNDFFFKTKKRKDNFVRLLLTEGIATYLTREVLGISLEQALWADYIPKKKIKKWIKQCLSIETELQKNVRLALHGKNVISSMFYTSNEADVRSYRAGYWIGYCLIKQIVNKFRLQEKDILNISTKALRRMAMAILNKKTPQSVSKESFGKGVARPPGTACR